MAQTEFERGYREGYNDALRHATLAVLSGKANPPKQEEEAKK